LKPRVVAFLRLGPQPMWRNVLVIKCLQSEVIAGGGQARASGRQGRDPSANTPGFERHPVPALHPEDTSVVEMPCESSRPCARSVASSAGFTPNPAPPHQPLPSALLASSPYAVVACGKCWLARSRSSASGLGSGVAMTHKSKNGAGRRPEANPRKRVGRPSSPVVLPSTGLRRAKEPRTRLSGAAGN
jgi:hypothetical protein